MVQKNIRNKIKRLLKRYVHFKFEVISILVVFFFQLMDAIYYLIIGYVKKTSVDGIINKLFLKSSSVK